jgi:hypothetical protein
MDVNVLLRGQSNAQYFFYFGELSTVQNEVQQLLGFDGTNEKVNIVASAFDPFGKNTINSQTAFLTDWMQHNPDGSWSVNTLEQGLLGTIANLPTAWQADPTAVVWLHNEFDAIQPGLTASTWMSAVRADAALVRQAFGQDAAHVPYLFVDAIPYDNADPGSNQQIKVGMQQLAADPTFHARIAAHINDANMDYDGYLGGSHMGAGDASILADRLARSIAETFVQYAQPGAPILQAGGNIDDHGPQVISAQVANPTDLILTVQHDAAGGFSPLDATAANGVGWSVMGSGVTAQATAAWIIDATHLDVHFNNGIPANGLLYYGYGVGRLAGADGSGHGHAVYDDQGLPIWASATGVAVDYHLL